MSERDKIINKIKKCLALSASSNEHEAAAALRQAKKLMEAHGISDLDMQAAEAGESRSRAGGFKKPANWEAWLASKIAKAFACQVILGYDNVLRGGAWIFIGTGAAPEIAEYAFRVLFRQAKAARSAHIKTRLQRCKKFTRTRRADLFCEGWVRTVAGKIAAFANTDQQSAAISSYLAIRYPELQDLESRNRNDGRKLRDHECDDLAAGRQAGRDAQFHRGVGGADQRLALGGVS